MACGISGGSVWTRRGSILIAVACFFSPLAAAQELSFQNGATVGDSTVGLICLPTEDDGTRIRDRGEILTITGPPGTDLLVSIFNLGESVVLVFRGQTSDVGPIHVTLDGAGRGVVAFSSFNRNRGTALVFVSPIAAVPGPGPGDGKTFILFAPVHVFDLLPKVGIKAKILVDEVEIKGERARDELGYGLGPIAPKSIFDFVSDKSVEGFIEARTSSQGDPGESSVVITYEYRTDVELKATPGDAALQLTRLVVVVQLEFAAEEEISEAVAQYFFPPAGTAVARDLRAGFRPRIFHEVHGWPLDQPKALEIAVPTEEVRMRPGADQFAVRNFRFTTGATPPVGDLVLDNQKRSRLDSYRNPGARVLFGQPAPYLCLTTLFVSARLSYKPRGSDLETWMRLTWDSTGLFMKVKPLCPF